MAVNCGSYPDICGKENVIDLPVVRVYPPMPIPAFDIEGEIQTKRIARACARYIENNVIQIASTNIDTFIMDSPSVPKVLLFSEKEKVPFMFKALSSAFKVISWFMLRFILYRKSCSLEWFTAQKLFLPKDTE